MPDDLGDAVKRAKSKKLRDGLTAAAERQAAATRTNGPTFTGWKGAWDRATEYQRGNVVSHEGSSWRAVADHRGSEPPSTMWQYVAKKGTDGKRGADGIGVQGPTGPQGPPGPGSDLDIEDEGVLQGIATTLDFTGAGVTASVVGGQATINVPGGGSGVDIEDEGVLQGTATTIDFAGSGVTASMTGPNDALITIAGGAPGSEYPEDSPMQDGDLGNFVLAVRNDADAVVTDTDGDFSQISVDDKGRVKVTGTVAATLSEPISVDDNGGSLTVDGSVAVSNFPAVQPVSDNGGSLTVDATNLDIRDLLFASDKVDVSGSTVTIQEPISVDDNGGSLTVDGTVAVSNFPATQPVSGTVTANQGTSPWVIGDGGGSITVDGTVSVNEPVSVDDNGGSLTVDAVDLDIRNLSSAQDSVAITDGGGSITVDGTVAATLSEPISVDDNGGSLTVDAANLDIRDLVFATDTVDVSGSTLVAEPGSVSGTLQSAASADGDGTPLDITGYSAVGLDITKTGTGTLLLVFEGAAEAGGNFFPLAFISRAASGATTYGRTGLAIATGTINLNVYLPVAGLEEVRARIASASGTISVTVDARATLGHIPAEETVPGTNVIGGTYPVNGEIIDNDGDICTVKFARGQVAGATAHSEIVAAVAGKRIRVLSAQVVIFTAIAGGFFNFAETGSATDITGSPMWMLTSTGNQAPYVAPDGAFLVETAAGNSLRIKSSANTGNVVCHITYIEVL